MSYKTKADKAFDTKLKGLLAPMKREELFERQENQRGGAEKLQFSDCHGSA